MIVICIGTISAASMRANTWSRYRKRSREKAYAAIRLTSRAPAVAVTETMTLLRNIRPKGMSSAMAAKFSSVKSRGIQDGGR